MDLVVFVEDFYPNISGGALTRWRFCQLAVEKGHNVTVFTPRRAETPAKETVDGVTIRRPFPAQSAGLPAYSVIAFVPRIVASIACFLAAVVWCFDRDISGIHSASTTMHWAAKALGMLYDTPVVNFVGYSPSAEKERQRWYNPKYLLEQGTFTYCMGDIVFSRTEKTKNAIRMHTETDVETLHGVLNADRIRDVHQHRDDEDVRSKFGIDQSAPLLVFVGRLSPLKQPVKAIEVLVELPEEYELLIVGDGPEKTTIETAVSQYGLTDRVTLTGELPHVEALKAIAASNALVLTSRTESYGAVVFEALAFNNHVFAPPIGVLPSVDHPRLHLVDVADFSKRITACAFDQSDSLDEGILNTYSMEQYTDDILNAFEQLQTGEEKSRTV